jgi:hypothetical protein
MASKLKLALAALLVAAFAGWYYYTPYQTVKEFRAAAQRGDAAALSEYIDLPSVKESLKMDLSIRIASDLSRRPGSGEFAALGSAFAIAFVGPMVETLVTPEALALMLRGENPSRASTAPGATARGSDTEVRMRYEGFNAFLMSTQQQGSTADPVVLVFEREGLMSWKLAAIRLPI